MTHQCNRCHFSSFQIFFAPATSCINDRTALQQICNRFHWWHIVPQSRYAKHQPDGHGGARKVLTIKTDHA